MNTFTKKHSIIYIVLMLVVSVGSIFTNSITAQEKDSANSNTNQSQTNSATIPVPTLIAVGDVVTKSEETLKRLEKITAGLDKNPDISVIETGLPSLKNQLDLQVADTNELLSVSPSLETLRTAEQNWQALAKDVPAWKDILKNRIVVLDNYLNELKDLKSQWQTTLKFLSADENSNTKNSNTESSDMSETEIPAEVLDKIRTTFNAIETTEKQIEAKRGDLLTLQTRVVREGTRIDEILLAIKEYREQALTHLFIKDSPPIWNARRNNDSFSGLTSDAGNSYSTQINALREYAFRRSDGFVIHGVILLIFAGVLFWARKRLRPMVKDDPELEPAFSAFEMPLVGAIILSIMFSSWYYPQAPRMLSAILGAAALIPGIIYLRKILEKPLFPILNALMIFYFVDQLRQITATLPLVSRILFIAEMIAVILFLVWFLRSKKFADKIEVKHQRIFVYVKKVIPFLLVLFSIALLANLLGFVSLSNIVGNSILGSAYIALILYTAIQIIKSLLVFALRVKPLSNLGMVKTHREIIKNKLFVFLKWSGIAIWAVLTLNLLSIRETLFTYLKEWLTAELIIGSIAVSLSDLIIFTFTVWLAFALSRLIRFILAEDIYTRIDLGGGVPYAVSTILHYVILVIGFVFAIAALGVDLTKFTILAGAFGVGLGFGLQTIVNNFVSGLILLFERPVKINDVVQVGQFQGDLKRIGLRASVLRALDGSEVIVPNGKLISEEVTNWTLSDPQRRLEINVGVAYGNKPREIIELLNKIAFDNEDVLNEPPPRTIFVGFGESSLDFQLRAWTDKDSWVFIKSELTLAVHDVLTEAGIEIPFPQRDLRLRETDAELIKSLQKS